MTTGRGGTVVLGPETGAGFGARVRALGDMNGDGKDDFAVSAPGAGDGYSSLPGLAEVGQTYIFYGGSGDLAAQIDLAFQGGSQPDGIRFSVIQGDAAQAGLGGLLSAAGDIDGDGTADLILGSADYGGLGTARTAYVIYGSAAGLGARVDLSNATRLAVVDGVATAVFAVAGLGDMNGDGQGDLLITNPAAGEAFILLGDGAKHPAYLTMTSDFGEQKDTFTGVTAGYAAGDMNDDGLADLLLVTAAGGVILYGSQAMGGAQTDLDSLALNGGNGFALGLAEVTRVEHLADVNGDGIDDLLVEGRSDTLAGQVSCYVLFGATSGFGMAVDLETLNGSNGFRVTGSGSGAGVDFGGTGDANGDGLRDFLLADASAEGGAGAVWLVYGKQGARGAVFDLAGLDGSEGYKIVGLAGDNLGGGQMSDVNGDGFADLVLGVPGRAAGGAVILYGGPQRMDQLDLADGFRDGVLHLSQLGAVLNFTEAEPVPIGGGGIGNDDPTQNSDKLQGTSGADVINLLGGDDEYGALAGNDLVYGNTGNDQIFGDTGDDTLYGDAGQDTLNGQSGADVLDGGSGADQMAGGDGDDLYIVDVAGDLLTEITNGGNDRVEALISFVLKDLFEDLLLLGNADLSGEGNALSNRLGGNSGANLLKGHAGADRLNGGMGADRLIGGAGRDVLMGGADAVRDVFVFAAPSETQKGPLRDVIGDFGRREDVIDLHLMDANRARPGNQAFVWNGASGPSKNAVWWVDAGTGLVLRGDVTGDGAADFEIRLNQTSGLMLAEVIL